MLVAGKSAAAAAAWVSVPEEEQVSAEQVWAPVAAQVWAPQAMVTSPQAHAPLPSG
jgi:hypothetical protein